ncbi:nuclear transport factor 2 family protein [Amycolatopsis thermophila]|uniref:Ketosteroid isomerase-like protein n=1 Tax=Amycolatopsis thermophila TaxID=206084 RepID=A0ABU0F5F2_9PSEU|nr:nuclear transport factor 2 family protein [Amycolatopsis thermophila]MDQ0382814.1 ketosteroid isomerase-like protein [Amycolatopsis thermophila]
MSRNTDIDTIRRFMGALCRLDIDDYLAFWAEDGVMEFPFMADPAARQSVGRDAIAVRFSKVPRVYESFAFEDVHIRPLYEDGSYVVEMRGRARLKNGRPYDNTYITMVRVRAGKVQEWREYFDPSIHAEAFRGES